MTASATSPRSQRKSLNLLLVLNPAHAWRWQAWLAEALRRDGHTVAVLRADASPPLPSTVRALLSLERLLFAGAAERASANLDDAEIDALPPVENGVRYDIAIDFTDGTAQINAGRILRPVFDGVVGEAGAILAVLERRGPCLGVLDSQSGLHEYGICALEHPEVITRGLDGVFSRMAGLLLRAIRHGEVAGEDKLAASAADVGFTQPVAFFARTLVHKASGRLKRLLGDAPRWYIAHRYGSPQRAELGIPWQTFTPLSDGGRCYFADPFVMMRGGVAHVFCEEVPFATGKGIISHFTIDRDGHASTPRPVLERPYHLSYPFVFERDGNTWMIPETSANRTVELYRAERFPDRWVKEAVLLEGVLADDATLVAYEGRLWLFASVRDWQASSWDALGLFHAPSLLGPWQAHAGNPVLLDPTASRPAGALFERDGQLIRPAQDCRGGYGSGLAFAHVDRLDEADFAQTVIARTTPKTQNTSGLHTYNRAGEVEVIDLFGTR